MKRRHLLHTALAGACLVASMPSSWAADAWPSRSIRIVHGFTPGGPVDSLARLISQQFTQRFGQTAFVEGKPGAGGTLGANLVAKAPADGYTLFLMASGHSAAPGLYQSLPFDPVNDFTMISMVASSPYVILAKTGGSISTIQQLVEQAKAKPGAVDYGSGGIGTGMHLAAVLFQSRLKLQMTHIPYKGGNGPTTALRAGEVPIVFTSLAGGIMGMIENGEVKPLAVTSRERFAALPDVPTISQTVIPDFDISAWYALAGPKGMPPDVVAKLNETLKALLQDPEVLKTLKVQAAQPWSSTPAQAQNFLGQDVERWTKVIKDEKVAIGN